MTDIATPKTASPRNKIVCGATPLAWTPGLKVEPALNENDWSWRIVWGAHSRQTSSGENQDGWFVAQPRGTDNCKLVGKSSSSCWESEEEQVREVLLRKSGSEISDSASTAAESRSIAPENAGRSGWGQLGSFWQKLRPRVLSALNSTQSMHNRRSYLKDPNVAHPSRPIPKVVELLDSTLALSNVDTYGSGEGEGSLESPWIFGVLDGHGTGGKLAARVGSKRFMEALRRTEIPRTAAEWRREDEVMQAMHAALSEAYMEAHQTILDKNIECRRDFGSTVVTASIVGRFLVAGNCGDSTAVLILLPPKPQEHNNAPLSGRVRPKAINLVRAHTLYHKGECSRIEGDGRGSIVVGDGNVLRLIPSHLTYPQARTRGFSINMSRALGHMVLNECALSEVPDYYSFDLSRYVDPSYWGDSENVEVPPHPEIPPFLPIPIPISSPAPRTPQPPPTPSPMVLVEEVVSPAVCPLWQEEQNKTPRQGCRFAEQSRSPEMIDTLTEPRRSSRLRTTPRTEPRPIPPIRTRPFRPHPVETRDMASVTFRWGSPEGVTHPVPEPTVRKTRESPDVFVILLSDGVSDVVAKDRLADIVLEHRYDHPASIAAVITSIAEQRRLSMGVRPDNCTATVIKLAAQT